MYVQSDARPVVKDANCRRAFTLVELMIAIALMLLLMIGINVIFSMTSRAVGAGQALSEGIKNAQSAQTIMSRDFETAVTDGAPFMIMDSKVKPAFRSRQEMLADRDFATSPTPASILTVDLDGDNQEGVGVGEAIFGSTYNSRNHRIDTVSFFSRDQHFRQTGGGTLGTSGTYQPLIADMSSNEAWIWYGHLHLPDNNGSFTVNTEPGAGTFGSNPNNYFASQWILGRVAMLLKQPESNGSMTTSSKFGQTLQHDYFIRDNAIPMSPLSSDTKSKGSSLSAITLKTARYDLAGTSMAAFREILIKYIDSNPLNNWWNTDPVSNNGRDLMMFTRYRCNPFVSKPLTAAAYAEQMPAFLTGCSQFIVEYAGDFIAQDNDVSATSYGQLTNVYFEVNTSVTPATDGQIDYVVDWTDTNGNRLIDSGERDSIKRRIRWYGLPRDVNGDGVILGQASAARFTNDLKDVVPLVDVMRTGRYTTSAAIDPALKSDLANVGRAPFERTRGAYSPGPTNASPTLVLRDVYSGIGGMTIAESYPCVWGPHDRMPSLFRITIVLDDANGRLGEGQSFEFVFKMQ